jgi:hypothetical protein
LPGVLGSSLAFFFSTAKGYMDREFHFQRSQKKGASAAQKAAKEGKEWQ